MAEEPQQTPEKTGREACEARIHNSSNRTIFLIPIQYAYYDYRGPIGIVVRKLANKIPVGGSIQLDRSNYDFDSEIFILFRAGDIDDVEIFLQFFLRRNPILKPGEMLFLIGHRDNLSLECNDGKVIGSSGAGLLPPTTIAEAPIRESILSQARRKVIVPRQIPEWVSSGLVAPPTKIHNKSDVPIFLISFSWVDGPDPQSDSVVKKDLVKQIPAGGFKTVDSRECNPVENIYDSQKIRILFRAGHTNNDEEFLGNLKVEPGEELYSPHYLFKEGDRYFRTEAEQVIEVDKNSLPISGMDFFRNAPAVCLRNCHDQYLVANNDKETVALRNCDDVVGMMPRSRVEETAMSEEMRLLWQQIEDSRRWYVEFVDKSDSVLHLKSCHGKYLTASELSSLPRMTGCQVLQSPPHSSPDFSLDLEPVKVGGQVKLRTRYDTFLCANSPPHYGPNAVTHDLYPSTAVILWDVQVGERVEGTATNIDDKASEEGSTSNIDNKASSATKRHHETGEGSSVTKSPPGNLGLIPENDRVRYRRHFWELKKLLLEDSGSEDLLIKGEIGTTALVREVCADVRRYFGTIAWISFPGRKTYELIREDIFVQLIFERVVFPKNFDGSTWILEDHEFSLQQKEGCLIVVDDSDDPRSWAKFEQILRVVETCRVIFLARFEMGPLSSQINQYGRKFKTHKVEYLSYVPRANLLMNFLNKHFPASSKGAGQIIVKECERLPTPIIFVLHKESNRIKSSEMIKDEWEARIPSVNPRHKFHVIQQLLKALYEDRYGNEGHELDHIQQVMQILCKVDHLPCLLYVSIFPENSLISCRKVSCLWAAEGFLSNPGKAEDLFDDPLWRKCIHAAEERTDGEVSTFRVKKDVLEIILLLFNLPDLETITSQGSPNWPETVRCVSVQGKIRPEDITRISSIFVLDVSSNEERTTTFRTSLSESSKTPSFPLESGSKVLDLEGVPFQIVQDALNSLFELRNPKLRYLSLSKTSIKVIPGSIEKLTHLEFLVLKHSLVTALPPQVRRLKRIRHILIYHHEKDPLLESYNLIGFKALCRIEGFSRLEKLCFVEATKRILQDLEKLTKLRRLGIAKLRVTHGKRLSSSLEKLEELKSLNVHAIEEDEIIDLNDLSSPPKHLKHLYLHGRLEKLPDWISSLNDLTRITLRWSQLEEDPLATLGGLPKLVELVLRRAYEGSHLDFKNEQFPKLKILVLDKLEGLRSMSLEKGTMPFLENLTISRCQWLERMPSGIEHFSTIQRLECFDMSSEFYEMVRADHEKDHYQNFKNIREVKFTQWRAGHWETHQVESTEEACCLPGFCL